MLQFVVEDLPGRLQHLDHDVVVDVTHEVSHLLMGQVESMESILHARKLGELIGVGNTQAPRGGKSMLDSLKFPQEIVDLLEYDHHIVRENGV